MLPRRLSSILTFVLSNSFISRVLFKFVLTLYKQPVKIEESCFKNRAVLPERFWISKLKCHLVCLIFFCSILWCQIVFLIAAWYNSFVDSFPHVMFMITNLIGKLKTKYPIAGKLLIFIYAIRNNCSEFRDGVLDNYFFKLTGGSNCLRLCFRTSTFKTRAFKPVAFKPEL